jgi:hypothetical protein
MFTSTQRQITGRRYTPYTPLRPFSTDQENPKPPIAGRSKSDRGKILRTGEGDPAHRRGALSTPFQTDLTGSEAPTPPGPGTVGSAV